MELLFNGGKFVSFEGELNYKEVLEDFSKAKTIRIITYNISKQQRNDMLLDALKSANADIQLITNVPSRMGEYFKSPAGEHTRSLAKNNIRTYISKLNPEKFSEQFVPYFHVNNHAKIIGTENVVYIGSANYSNESANNIESGVIIRDKEFIQKLYIDFFDSLKNESLSYFDENFSAFQLLILSLYTQFTCHHRKMLQDLYTDYMRIKLMVADSISLDVTDLEELYKSLDDFESLFNSADETYDEANEKYNEELEKLKERVETIDVEFLKETISEDGRLYNLVVFDSEQEVDEILQEDYSAEAYDDQLDFYIEKAMDKVAEMYSSLHNAFEEEADAFLSEIEKILSVLETAVQFADKWKGKKINPDIDNT